MTLTRTSKQLNNLVKDTSVFSLDRKLTTQAAVSSSAAETTTPSSTSSTWTLTWIRASTTAMPPTCWAAATRWSCWGFAVTWRPYGLFWGCWPRSSSWSSSSLFMRSARSQTICKTVSHRRWRLGLLLLHCYYSTVFITAGFFCITEEDMDLSF